jgi:hypothetical protein
LHEQATRGELRDALHEQATGGELQVSPPLSTGLISSRAARTTGIQQGTAVVTFTELPGGTWAHQVAAIPHMTTWVHPGPVQLNVELWVVSGSALVHSSHGNLIFNAGSRTFLTGLLSVSVTAAPSVPVPRPPGRRTAYQQRQQLRWLQNPRIVARKASSDDERLSPVEESTEIAEDGPEVEPGRGAPRFARSGASVHGACNFSQLAKHGASRWK